VLKNSGKGILQQFAQWENKVRVPYFTYFGQDDGFLKFAIWDLRF